MERKVKDIMSKEVISLKPDTTVKEALKSLFQLRISGLPVIENERLVGMFTEKDILQYILPSYIEKIGSFVYTEESKVIKRKLMELATLKVADLMRKEVVTVEENASIDEVARIMLTQKIRRIPVLNKDGKVVGIIAREDIVKALIKSVGLVE